MSKILVVETAVAGFPKGKLFMITKEESNSVKSALIKIGYTINEQSGGYTASKTDKGLAPLSFIYAKSQEKIVKEKQEKAKVVEKIKPKKSKQEKENENEKLKKKK